jgi:hypothetical protein
MRPTFIPERVHNITLREHAKRSKFISTETVRESFCAFATAGKVGTLPPGSWFISYEISNNPTISALAALALQLSAEKGPVMHPSPLAASFIYQHLLRFLQANRVQ